ncbi:integrator complex subunit 8 [Tribolium madens]|uniref:integrator complex subunit 8 n=1 Tax=Tribolium madens TaxID=41895 RepID=UPI001CF76143|nr:integrator complex subunit 8 [Tribolium madens]
MDVDLLRPGTVPIAPDTVLWFEFLLHHDLLLSHLQKPAPDPSPTELIAKFSDAIADTLRNRLETENGEMLIESMHENVKQPAKNIALKILSLKVAAFIKWDLGQIRTLPFKTQVHLLQVLLYFTNDKTTAEIPNIDLKPDESVPSPYLFALVVYHRWLLNVTMHRITSNWQMRLGNTEISPAEENIICSHENVRKTVEFLKSALNWDEVPSMLTFDCFKLPSETNGLEFDWSSAQSISKEEFCAQLNYDLGTFFFYKEDYNLARDHFTKCLSSYKAMKENNGFVKFNIKVLEVYVRACSGDGSKGSLLEQLNTSVVNQFMGITSILQQDNIFREIPLAHRITLELDIQGALSSGTFTVARDLLNKIRALNVVRCVLDRKPTYHCSLKSAEILVWAAEVTCKSLNDADRNLIKKFLLDLVLKNEIPDLLSCVQANETLSKLFDKSELSFIKNRESNDEIPESLHKTSWILYDCFKKRKPKLEIKQLEQDLIATYDHKEIRELLKKISANQLATSVWNINPLWDLPIPIQSVIKSLPRGFLQDFSFVMMAKVREQMLNKVWISSFELLLILDKELGSGNGNIGKLSRLISWEILLVQITQLLEEWPKSTIDKVALADACEACLQTNNESVLPRTEITEHCVLCLLNLGRWEFLINFDKRWPSFEITSAIALACQELIKQKGNKKLSKNLWEIVLPIFGHAPQQSKRGNSGNSVFHDAQAQITNLRNSIMAIFGKLRDSTVLAVVISMLARLHNILKDETSLEVQVDYVMLWPAVISNANSYNMKVAHDVLSQMVTQALQYYPTNIPWLRLMGDINFANGHYNVSLKYYLKSLLIYNDYFNIPVRHDDHVFRRMIKCCIALGCNTQAAVLCQFLEEPDYVLAFRILGDQKYCNDAVDAYYHCIWDTNILEYLIHTHNKRGEYQRRKCATQVIGSLEVNSNNNEEIQREASNLRKSTFLRALCKQYVF